MSHVNVPIPSTPSQSHFSVMDEKVTSDNIHTPSSPERRVSTRRHPVKSSHLSHPIRHDSSSSSISSSHRSSHHAPSPSPSPAQPPMTHMQLPQSIPSNHVTPESTSRRRTKQSDDDLTIPRFHHEEKNASDEKPHKTPLMPTGMTLTCGHFSMQGIRNEMEDKVTLLLHPEFNQTGELADSVSRSFFAVFDGHGGDVSAEYCHQHVHLNLLSDASFGDDPVEALRHALIKTDEDFCGACRRIHLVTSSGTTAITTYVENDTLVVANVGDSRAILVRQGRAIAISQDHKPGRPDERARIESLGGRVATTEDESYHQTSRSCLCMRRFFGPNRPLRVFPGGLSVSRTIGDISMKSTQLIISEPEMYTCRLTRDDQFMVLACDGVWDVMNNQQAADVVRKHLTLSSHDADAASRALAKEAYRRGSTDNISVIVVVFHHPPEETPRTTTTKSAS